MQEIYNFSNGKKTMKNCSLVVLMAIYSIGIHRLIRNNSNIIIIIRIRV